VYNAKILRKLFKNIRFKLKKLRCSVKKRRAVLYFPFS